MTDRSARPAGRTRARHRGVAGAFAVPAALLAFLLAALPIATPARAQLAELRVLDGSVTVTRDGRRRTVTDRTTLRAGARLETNAVGRVHVRFVDAGTPVEAVIGPGTRVTVHDLGSRESPPPFSLLFGALRARVREFTGAAPFLTTFSAAVGIKGTDFVTTVRRRDATEFIGIDGRIEAVDRTRSDFRLTIGRRQWGEIVAGQPPAPPIRVPDALWLRALADFAFPAAP